MADSYAVELTHLSKFYGEVRGIEELTLAVEHGEIFGLLGPNGAGKSTAIRTLLGLLKPTSGGASLLGHPVTDRVERQSVMANVGHIPGEFGFYESLTGTDLLDYFERLRGGERRAELGRLFPVPFERAVKTYSRGNRQKLAMIQAFMHDPDLVVMDEPTSGLDPLVQNTFYDFLDRERERGVTVLFSSHILSEVRRVCDRVAIIRDGRLVALERIEALLEKSGKVVRVAVRERPDPTEFDIDGVRTAAYDTDDYLKLVVTDNYDGLIDALARYTIEDIEIRETSLEDVFIHFYTDDVRDN